MHKNNPQLSRPHRVWNCGPRNDAEGYSGEQALCRKQTRKGPGRGGGVCTVERGQQRGAAGWRSHGEWLQVSCPTSAAGDCSRQRRLFRARELSLPLNEPAGSMLVSPSQLGKPRLPQPAQLASRDTRNGT